MVGYWQDRAQRQQKSVVTEGFSLNPPFPSLASHFQGCLEPGLMPGLRKGQNCHWPHREWGTCAEEGPGWHLGLLVLYSMLAMKHIPLFLLLGLVTPQALTHNGLISFILFLVKRIHEKKANEKQDMSNYLKRWLTKSPETPEIRSTIPVFKHWLRTY